MAVWHAAALVGVALVSLVPAGASAQARRRGESFIHGPLALGPRVGRDFENHAWSVGGQVSIPVGTNLELRPSGDVFFPKDGDTGWQANGDAAFQIGSARRIYAGGGIAFAHPGGGETKTGYNLFAGVSADRSLSRTTPFLEARWTFVNDTSPFRLALGFNYRLGG
jgi:hypothetical protein